MISVDEALDLLADAASPLARETVELSDALGRVAAAAVDSPVDLPPFAQSAMDGYAIRGAETEGASESTPVTLEVVGEVAAGETGELPGLGEGEAVLVNTGGRIPEGADTVVRRERVRRTGSEIRIERSIPVGKDLRPAGEELEAGELLVSPGRRLDERHLAALSMTGHPKLEVRRCPSIAILASGDEVVPPSADRRPGQIYDANSPFLEGLLGRLGYREVDVRHLADEPDGIAEAIDGALEEFDLVVTTGGVSVGEHDHVHEAADRVGARRILWQVDQKPGRPVLCAARDGTPLLGLPGNPGAVFVDTHAYLLRLLDRLEGASELRPHFRHGRVTGPVERSSGRVRWAPCRATHAENACYELEPIERGRAHRMGRLFRADALARIEPGEGAVDAGSLVPSIPCAP